MEGVNISRLDRLYVSDMFSQKGGTIKIMPGTSFSDHTPVILSLVGKKPMGNWNMCY